MELGRLFKGRVVVVGVGNELRGDDGVGAYVARKVKKRNVINAEIAPENFVGKIKKMRPGRIVIVDALDFGGRPGEIRVVDARKTTGLRFSTHALPLSFFCEYFEGIEVQLVGIQPKRREFGSRMSREVRKAAERIIGCITPQ